MSHSTTMTPWSWMVCVVCVIPPLTVNFAISLRTSCVRLRTRMRVAVVGHVEWVEFARVERVPVAGEIVHALDAWEEPGGGGRRGGGAAGEAGGRVPLPDRAR